MGCSKAKSSSPIIFVAFLLLIVFETSEPILLDPLPPRPLTTDGIIHRSYPHLDAYPSSAAPYVLYHFSNIDTACSRIEPVVISDLSQETRSPLIRQMYKDGEQIEFPFP